MRKSNWKPFAMGCLVTAIVMSSTPAFAETTKSIQATFGRIVLMVNGQKVDQETLLYDGVTYVPIRAAAETLGMEVTYDGANFLAYLDPKGTNRVLDNAGAGGSVSGGGNSGSGQATVQMMDDVGVDFLLDKIRLEEDEGIRLYYLDLEVNAYFDEYLKCVAAKDTTTMNAYAQDLQGRTMAIGEAIANGGLHIEQQYAAVYDEYHGLYFYLTDLFLWMGDVIEKTEQGNVAAAAESLDHVKADYAAMMEMNGTIITKTTEWPDLAHGTTLQVKLNKLR